MNNEENGNPVQAEDISSTDMGPEQKLTKLPEAGPQDPNSSVPIVADNPRVVLAIEQQLDADGSASSSIDNEAQTD
jgi:hypothetical protein